MKNISLIFINLFFFSPASFAADCANIEGTFRVEKDAVYGGAYTIVNRQNACEELTQTVTYDDGGSTGPLTAQADGMIDRYCSQDYPKRCYMKMYTFTNQGFKALEIDFYDGKMTDTWDNYAILLSSGDLKLLRVRFHSDGKKEEHFDIAKKVK